MTKGKELLDRVRGKLLAISNISDDVKLAATFRQEFIEIMADFLLLDSNVQSLERDVVIEQLLTLADNVQEIAQQMSLNGEEQFFVEEPLVLEEAPELEPDTVSKEEVKAETTTS